MRKQSHYFRRPKNTTHSHPDRIVLTVTLLSNGLGWLFTWSGDGSEAYRVVLRGELLAIVPDGGDLSYTYEGVDFTVLPPPIEVVPVGVQAASELNQPFVSLQWYSVADAAYYEVQEYVDSAWQTWFTIDEVGGWIYSWSSPFLVDGSTHNYRVIAYNDLGQESDPLEYDITVVTPPDMVESDYTISYDEATNKVVLDLA